MKPPTAFLAIPCRDIPKCTKHSKLTIAYPCLVLRCDNKLANLLSYSTFPSASHLKKTKQQNILNQLKTLRFDSSLYNAHD